MHRTTRKPALRSPSLHRLLLPLCMMGMLLGAGALGNAVFAWQTLRTDMSEKALQLVETMGNPKEAPPDTRWWVPDPSGSAVGMTQPRS